MSTVDGRVRRIIRNYFRDGFVNVVAFSPMLPDFTRAALLRFFRFEIGRSRIGARGYFGGWNLSIADGVFLARGAYLDASAQITIGSRAQIGPFVKLITSTHKTGSSEARAGAADSRPISIGAGAWLGADVMVLPGVTVGAGAVIAAGAVVVRDCEENWLYAGVPAKRVRHLD